MSHEEAELQTMETAPSAKDTETFCNIIHPKMLLQAEFISIVWPEIQAHDYCQS